MEMVIKMNNLSLKDKVWKEFIIEDLFVIKRGKRYVKANQKEGNYPYISSKALNNGIDNFTVPTDKNPLHKNFIGINNSGSVGIAFFHPYKAVVSDHVTTMKNEYTKNMYVSLFLTTVLENCNKGRYSFNYEMNNERLKRSKIILPINVDGNPDYDFMEAYMKQIEKSLDTSLLKKINEKVNKNVVPISNTDWSEYVIEEVFDTVDSSPYSLDFNALEEKYKSEKQIPYVTRTSKNNGISDWIKDMTDEGSEPIKANCITIGLDTATVNYQPYPFYTGQNIHIVRDKNINKYNAMFIIPLIEQSLAKFGWGGYSATLGRFRKTRVMLPSKNNKPDWEFMDNYIKSLSNSDKI
ncbi:hypothetical protein HMPREF3291_08610 [Bacillus sp. HMSC76G11]|nr:hypothetical protein HMPREF3291_08610 [Bacillus sp. HMSC76G11]